MTSGKRSAASATKRLVAVRDWDLWDLPVSLVLSVLTVELTAVVLVALGALEIGPPLPADLWTALLIVVLGALHTEIARRVEQVRRWVTGTNLHVNLSSVWFFAAAVLLPPAYAGVTAAIVFSHLWWRSAGVRAPLHRQVFNTAAFVLACFAASASMSYLVAGVSVAERLDGISGTVLVVGMLVFTTVNTALVAGAVAVSNPRARPAQMLGDWNENLLEVATLCLGGIVAAAVTASPWLALAVFPPLLVLHRAVLVQHLEEAASTDGKTGLLNAAAWHSQAERELRRAMRREAPRAVLVVDLDHFKSVNDTHGHLAGDQVLAAVADALRSEVRDRDLVGRFGGEEFVVLLGELGGDSRELGAVAERIRRRIAALRVEMPTPDGPLTVAGLSASVGGALYPGDGRDVRTLLHVADTALYAAKRAGRNLVRLGTQLPIQTGYVAEDAGVSGPSDAR